MVGVMDVIEADKAIFLLLYLGRRLRHQMMSSQLLSLYVNKLLQLYLIPRIIMFLYIVLPTWVFILIH